MEWDKSIGNGSSCTEEYRTHPAAEGEPKRGDSTFRGKSERIESMERKAFRSLRAFTLWGWFWRVAAIAAALLVQWLLFANLSDLPTESGPDSVVPAAEGDSLVAADFPPPSSSRPDGSEIPPDRDSRPSSSSPRLTLSKDVFTGDLQGILKRRHVRVLTTFNRTNFFLAGGQQRGFEYSLLRDYEEFLNRGRGRKDLKIHMEFIPVHRDELMPKLLSGEGDIAAAGLTITPAREKEVDFTAPYLDGIDEVVVTRRGVRDLERIEDLSGREVRVRRSSSYHESLLELNETLRRKGLTPARVVPVDERLETEDILELVNAGVWEITVADSHIAQIWSGVHRDLVVHERLKVREGGRIAWMVRKESPKLRGSLDGFIKTRRKGTKFGNIYFNRYFKDDRWVAMPLAELQRKKLDEYVPLFRKYSSKYDIPLLFTAAVAYQESGFDQRKRSRAGAVGVMQVLPSTAADKNIAVADIADLENNIHAGVKYLAFLRDHYFGEGKFDDAARMHFVLASYNAGPGNIRKARRKAPSWGVEADRWFKNVEVVVLRTVSQEPVQYVLNINRYYLLFEQYFRVTEEKKKLKRQAGG
jgi:membrane-bound lytic murein transglycosylase MltF